MATKLAHITRPSLALQTRYVEKPWGRTDLPLGFGCRHGRRIGEIWFEHDDFVNPALLVKYLFTSESLSIQVHPTDSQASSRGFCRGKSESWYVLAAEPDAKIGLGLSETLSDGDLRAAARDGSVVDHMNWHPVKPGDFIFVPAGTIHAIGAGISLIEVQQNLNVAYRLYDYGRPREVHVEDAISVARAGYDFDRNFRAADGPANCVLADTQCFSIFRASSADALPRHFLGRRRWVIPVEGTAAAEDIVVSPGGCLLAEAGAALSLSSTATVLVGVEGRI